MSSEAAAFARAAEALLGVRFRLLGRDWQTGLDCAGVVLASLAAVGRTAPRAAGYGLRNRDHAPYLALLEQAGFHPCLGPTHTGDVIQVHPGLGQLHLLIAAADGSFIHAHAGLGRVVRTPPPLTWPVAGCWRLDPKEKSTRT